jgi:hypothetical protein
MYLNIHLITPEFGLNFQVIVQSFNADFICAPANLTYFHFMQEVQQEVVVVVVLKQGRLQEKET